QHARVREPRRPAGSRRRGRRAVGRGGEAAMADGDGARPMTEAEWERRFRENDLRAARYGDLFETLIDDPNRDEIVAREMGWLSDEDDEEPAEDDEAPEEEEEDLLDLMDAEP